MYSKLQKYNILIFAVCASVWLFSGVKGQAQSINVTGISENPICAGSSVMVYYTLTDGKGGGVGGNKQFQAGTIITISLHETALGTFKLTEFTLAENDIPTDNTTGVYTFSTEVIIPANSLHSVNYEIIVDSQNPSPQGNKPGIFSDFIVDAQIGNNTISESQVGCNPYTSQPLTGLLPTGGNNMYTYLWESSTTDPYTGFSPAPGTNNDQDYAPGTLTQTTWFRRVVTSGVCTNASNVIEITVSNDNTWTGDMDTDWNTPGNWSCNAVPIPVTNVIIPSNLVSNNYPILNTGAIGTANNLNIATGASLTISNNVLELGGGIINQGIFDAQNGHLSFVGTAGQTLQAGSLANDRVANLTVKNTAGLILDGPVEVTGKVLVQTGNITSNGNLTLISDATQTALIDGSGAGGILGNVSMQRYLDIAYGYKYFSTPFQNTTVGDFSPYMDLKDPATGFPHFYGYDESRKSGGEDASGWVIDTLETNTLKIGRGYAVNFGSSSDAVTLELTGEVNNGQIDITLTNNNGVYTQGYYLLGNPYPSPIDWKQVTSTNVEDAIYFFTAGTTDQYTGVYSSVVGGVSSDGKSSTIIPSMQGFFVKVADGATTGSVSFQNSARISNFSQEFLKKPKSKKSDVPLIRLQAGYKSNPKDALVIYFPNNAKSEFEADKDAQKLFNTDPNVPSFYSVLENDQKLSINGLSFSEERIPLGIKAEKSGEMNISLRNVQNLPPGSIIYLLDDETGRMTNLLEKQSYPFKINKGEHNDRFFLFLSNKKLSAAEMDLVVEPFSVYADKGEILVKLNLPGKAYGNIILSNISGQLLQKKNGRGKEEIRFDGINAPGIYLVTVEGGNKRITKKIILKK